jgi:hypothetical protein
MIASGRLAPRLSAARRRPPLRPARAIRCAASLAAVAWLAACGSAVPAGSGQATPRAHAGGRSATPVAACAASALRVTIDSGAAGAAAGTSYLPIEFVNASSRSCRLTRYPAVAFATGAVGRQIGAVGAVERRTRARALVLAPGKVAHAWIQVLDVGNYPAGRCKPVQARGLRISFAGTDSAAFLAHPFLACASAMHGSVVLAVFPVQAGRAKRGTVP